MSEYLPIVVTPDDAKNARLPDNYKAALKAIEQCEKIDECQDWADKHAALASYHRQANDREMYNSALRVQANAVRRIGDLLKILPKAPSGAEKDRGGRPPLSFAPASNRRCGCFPASSQDRYSCQQYPKG
jgi:hypothetical protein